MSGRIEMKSENTSQAQQRLPRPSRVSLTIAFSGSVVAILAALLNLRNAQSALLLDMCIVALCCPFILLRSRGQMRLWVPWTSAGAFLGASVIGVLGVAPFVLLAAGLYVAAGKADRITERPRLPTLIAVLTLAAAANGAFLWLLIFSEHRPFPAAEYLAKDLRAHVLLADVPLHDVWVAQLEGGPASLDMLEIREMLIDGFRHDRNTGFLAAAAIRGVLGSMLGWDEDHCRSSSSSFVHRLTDADRARSIAPPGEDFFVYTFENEAMIEIINCTVHALIVTLLEPVDGGHTVYWAFYVKPIGGITSFYMGLIQPFRIGIIYPSIIEGIERKWRERW
jgi:hypothetical protein